MPTIVDIYIYHSTESVNQNHEIPQYISCEISGKSPSTLKQAKSYIGKTFHDVDDNIQIMIVDIVKSTTDKRYNFFKFYDYNACNKCSPSDINQFEFQTIVEILKSPSIYKLDCNDIQNTSSSLSAHLIDDSPTDSFVNLLRDYPDLYNNNTKLLEISLDHYGIFTCVSPASM